MKPALLAAAMLLLTSPAIAQQAAPAPAPTAPPPGGPVPGQPPAPPRLPQLPPPPAIIIAPGPYIRGDAGGAFSDTTTFRDTVFNETLGAGVRIRGDSGTSPIFDLGAGWRFFPWLRADLTVSRVTALHFSGSDNVGFSSSNHASIHSWAALANVYFDLPPMLTIFGPVVQPYFDLGLGAARNEIGPLTSTFIGGSFASHTETSPALGVGVGFGVPIANHVMLDFAYKFLDLGEVRTGSVQATSVAGVGTAPIKAFLGVHTLMLGARFGF